jgi:arginine N-succinyltransferase
MLRVRPATEADLDPLYQLILRSDDGLTSLKITREQLQDRLENSAFAFRRQSQKVSGLPYVFVMEDLATAAVVGTSSIYSKVGGYEPFYAYQIEKSIHESKELGVYREIDVLHLHKEHDGPTEIGSLFLLPDYWGKGNGKLLSLARFLYMAEFPDRFDAMTIAEMRGVIDRAGRSPFWDALGSHFFQIAFPRAVMLLTVSKNFVADLMPKHPIYLPLLPADARDVVGQVHQDTRPALAMLQKQGFVYQGFVDIFDGGPVVHATTAEIATIAHSRRVRVANIAAVQATNPLLIARAGPLFTAVLGSLDLDGDQATLSESMAAALGVTTGDALRIAPL